MTNYFAFEKHEYVRELNPVSDYIEMQTFFINKMTGKPKDEIEQWIKLNLRQDGLFPIKNKTVRYLSRENQRDRVRATTNILEYFQNAVNNNLVMTPSWTCYVRENVRRSLYTSYIEYESGVRSKYKKLMFIAEQRNDVAAVKFNNGMQSSAKIDINSLSGSAMSKHTINHTQSLHPSLTSVCASSTSYANLNNEKLIMGNRNYKTYQTVLDNIIVICLKSDMITLAMAMEKYNLHYPSTDDVMECIHKSTRHYWHNEIQSNKLRTFVDKLEPIEKAAFVYIGDLYHIDKHNPEVFKEFITGFTKRTYESVPKDDWSKTTDKVDGDVEILAKLICADYMMGKTIDDLHDNEPDKYGELVANMRMIEAHLDKYEIFIKGLLRPTVLNPDVSLWSMHGLMREAVLTSDTDSTIFTTQYWVKRMVGDIGFTTDHYNVGYTISFLVNKTVFNQLALLSKNLGIEDKYIHHISMKNEYYFPTYVLTNSAKNYYAYMAVREGNVYLKPKLEKKGVELRSSKIPNNVMSKFDEWIKYGMDEVIARNKITLDDLFTIPYYTEVEVKRSILAGEPKYYQTAQIKDSKAYKQGNDASVVKGHEMWQEVFAPKYGVSPPVPYVALKVSTTLTSSKKLKEWVDSIEDRELATRLHNWLVREGKKDLGTMYVPKATIDKGLIPIEIVTHVDTNKQIMNVMSPFYLALESFGFYLRNPNNTVMIHDYYNPSLRKTA